MAEVGHEAAVASLAARRLARSPRRRPSGDIDAPLQLQSPAKSIEPAPLPDYLKNLSLIDFLESSCRPACILRCQLTTAASDNSTEYENSAFSRVYAIHSKKVAFIKKALEVVSEMPAGVTSFSPRIIGHQCTCTLLPDGLVLVSWNAVPVVRNQDVAWSSEDQSLLSIIPPHINGHEMPIRKQPSNLSLRLPDPWEAGSRELGWTRYKDMQLTAHQKRIASYPWHETTLGDISTWSISHKLAVSASTMNPNPRCLYWGPNLVAMYNEHCIPIFGLKHPGFLGQNPADIWPETWAAAEPFALQAMHQGKPSRQDNMQLFINRKGFLEEAFFDSVWLPIPGVDSEDNGVLNQFTEVTDSSIAKRQQNLVTLINDRVQHVDNIHEFWTTVMSSLQDDPSDVAYAILFTPEDVGSPAQLQPGSPSLNGFTSTQYALRDQLGFSTSPLSSDFRFTLDSREDNREPLIDTIRHAYVTDKVVILEQATGTLPAYLNVASPDRGFGDTVTSAAVLTIASMHRGAPSAFLVLGLNPRRPVDDRSRAFAQVIRDCLVKGAAVSNLPSHARRHQKQMDELHQSLLARLHESNLESRRLSARFQRISDSAPIGMFIGSADARQTLYVNDEYLNLMATTREQLKKPVGWLENIADEDVERIKTALARTVTEFKPITLEFRTKMDFQVVDEVTGHPIFVPRYLMVTCIPEFDEHGNVSCIQGWVLNVSQERFTQRLLNSRLEEVTASKQNAENFIDMVSHEMRNPLSAILQSADGVVSLLETSDHTDKRRLSLSAETVESVLDASQTIILCAQHQKRIVDDILTLSKLDANLLVISPDKADPAKLLPKALKMFEAQLVRSSIDVSINIDPSVAILNVDQVMMDSSRILQIVINLLTNAIKFTSHAKKRAISLVLSASIKCPADATEDTDVEYIPRRGSRPRNSIVDVGSGDEIYLTFMVRDTGKGLTTEEKTNLFQKFSQASPKTYKKYGGSGLGLFISRELTELQGGQIGVSSEAGKGSTFAFYVLARRWQPSTPHSELSRVESVHTPTMLESPVAYSRRESAAMFDSSARSGSVLSAIGTPPPGSPDRTHFRQNSTSNPSISISNSKDKAITTTLPMSVLIVEDNVINQKVMAKQIRAAGHTVHVANHGLEALAFLRRTTFCAHIAPSHPQPDYLNQGTPPVSPTSPGPIELSVVLMDLEMPILDGLSCVRQIRAMEAAGEVRGHVPVIAVTANARSEQITIALNAGMDEVVTKPFRIWQVLERAAGLVGREAKLEAPFAVRPPVLRSTTSQLLDLVREDVVPVGVLTPPDEKRAGLRADSFTP